MKEFTVSEPALRVQNTLGEGPIWDARKQRLYWVDIDQRRVWTYEPSSGTYGYETFEGKLSSLALRESHPGLISTSEFTFVLIPDDSLPWPPTNAARGPQKTIDMTPKLKESLRKGTNRFNDGYCDPAGRFLAGTMGFEHSSSDGVLYRLDSSTQVDMQVSKEPIAAHNPATMLENVTCTNGAGWTREGDQMYFTDSWIKTIFLYDYDIVSAGLKNKRVFSDSHDEDLGFPDGLTMDEEDGVWSARWAAGKVARFDKSGHLDVIIHFPQAWNMTCVCWGGPLGSNLDELYVTSASSTLSGESDERYPQSGDLFVVRGTGFKGREKFRFRG